MKKQYFVLTCTKGHTWNEPVPPKKVMPGEYRACPTCGGSSWIAADAPRVWIDDPKPNVGDTGLINAGPFGEVQATLVSSTKVPRHGVVNIVTDEMLPHPSPDAVAVTKAIPVPSDLIPGRKLLNEVKKIVDEVESVFKKDDKNE
jgi:hypothetical protein